VTEEIWSTLPRPVDEPEHVMIAHYPEPLREQGEDPEVDRLEALIDVIGRVRNIRGEMGVAPSQKVDLFLLSDDTAAIEPLHAGEEHLLRLGNLARVVFGRLANRPPVSSMAVAGHVEIHVALADVDLAEEARRLEKELAKIDGELESLDRKLANPSFVERAPAEVVAETRRRQEEAIASRAKLAESLSKISGSAR
jgi:valyl-tRNA synthetase